MKDYDVIVVGSGHAGCEAALASARMGCQTLLVTLNIENVALMACNPSIGGPAKGHLVREIDALGGEMARNMDKACLQIRMLNTKKGPAVQALRGQADKRVYHQQMVLTLQTQDRLDIRQTIVDRLIVEGGRIAGIVSNTGTEYRARAVVIASGTYLGGKIHIGGTSFSSGPYGQHAALRLTDSLRDLGFTIMRLKTGTPPRLDGRTIDFQALEPEYGDPVTMGFSFWSDPPAADQAMCWILETNESTHRLIHQNIHRAPLYSGAIKGRGPRYCPSIETKVREFPEKERHQLFLEPETKDMTEFYLAGLSTSLPEDVQLEMVRSIRGLERAKIIRFGYAIEYDAIDPTELTLHLESKRIPGLFFAGQVNGSSGYEEAAAQGIMAGINAARLCQGRPPIVLDRSQAYIGVLIDDLVTKGTDEPYRMMTARAEYRLQLRQDNADLRLSSIGHEIGLLSSERYRRVEVKRQAIQDEIERLRAHVVTPNDRILQTLADLGESPIYGGVSLAELLKRPGLNYRHMGLFGYKVGEMPRAFLGTSPDGAKRPYGFAEMPSGFAERPLDSGQTSSGSAEMPPDFIREIEVTLKYEGYLLKQHEEIERFRRLERLELDTDLDYWKIPNISWEAKEKLTKIRPRSVGQASRVTGVSPADISMLLMYLKKVERGS